MRVGDIGLDVVVHFANAELGRLRQEYYHEFKASWK